MTTFRGLECCCARYFHMCQQQAARMPPGLDNSPVARQTCLYSGRPVSGRRAEVKVTGSPSRQEGAKALLAGLVTRPDGKVVDFSSGSGPLER
jgi:hypothetical protein